MGVHAKLALPMAEAFSQIETKRVRAAVAKFDMPTSIYWRGVMERARKARGISQEMLAKALDCSQPTVSDIESGKIGGSKYVPGICEALGIPLPIILTEDEFDERWADVGRLLRAKSMRRFKNYLANFEEEVGIEPSGDDQSQGVESGDGELEEHATERPGAHKTR